MCGIAGLYLEREEERASILARMLQRLVHRGPDDQGIFAARSAAIGIRRLSIIDLETGHQPLGNEDGSIQCVANGEIYNYLELRQELLQRGHAFRSRSDAEVIVHLYEEEGLEFVRHLRGMFALALFDTGRNELILVRDRLGVKPLVYAENEKGFFFASEIDALLAGGLISREPDPAALEQILTLGYALAPRTAFRAVRRLPPGHLLRFRPGNTELRRYWNIPREPARALRPEEAEERFLARLRESVRLRLRSDVPVGAFLSGGLDSSLLTAVAAGESAAPLRTFTIGFPGSPEDESAWAAQVASRYGTLHQNLAVEQTEAAAVIEDLIAHHGEPFGDVSAIPTWFLAKMAGSQVKVALGGDGGDELLAGYTRYQGERFAHWWRQAPGPVRAALRRLAPRGGRIGRVLLSSGQDPIGRYLSKSQLQPPGLWDSLYHPDWRARRAAGSAAGTAEAEAEIARIFGSAREMDWVGQVGICDFEFCLPNDMLFKVDAASMAHSLEVRLPYLDYLLVEDCARLPGSLKLRRWTRKYLMRRAARTLLPAELIARRKQGFVPPLARWFASGLERPARERLLESGGACGRILDRQAVAAWLDREPAPQALWSALLLDAWVRRYL